MLKLTILLSLAVVFFIIGVHQTINVGFAQSYGLFMLMLVCFFCYLYFKDKLNNKGEDTKNKK